MKKHILAKNNLNYLLIFMIYFVYLLTLIILLAIVWYGCYKITYAWVLECLNYYQIVNIDKIESGIFLKGKPYIFIPGLYLYVWRITYYKKEDNIPSLIWIYCLNFRFCKQCLVYINGRGEFIEFTGKKDI